MDLGIAGRRAAVAAGSAGLGFAVAAALAAEGVDVAICGRDQDRLTDAVNSLGEVATGAWPLGLVADVSGTDGAAAFVEQAAVELGGPIDILVANGGGPAPGVASGTTVEQYREGMESSCLATIAMASAASGPMRQQGWGRILAITSVGARQPIDFLAASNVARAAVTAYLKLLSTELAPEGVTVNNLQPGTHHTDRVASLGTEQADSLRSDIPAGDLGDPADFGAMAAMLCSEHARFTTGVGLHVDGGAFRGLQ